MHKCGGRERCTGEGLNLVEQAELVWGGLIHPETMQPVCLVMQRGLSLVADRLDGRRSRAQGRQQERECQEDSNPPS